MWYVHSEIMYIMENATRAGIDRLDLRLLDILQRQGALSAAEVAARTRISTTTCWRRIQQLEQNGVSLFDSMTWQPRWASSRAVSASWRWSSGPNAPAV